VEHEAIVVFGMGWEFGTLLGPEETPVGVFLVLLLAWPSNASECLCSGVVVVVGWGVVVC
jgi:hypothetical protein